ncbi:hypothetical protein [Moorella sp. Hama-1]|uniref:hypothetical protein n=1 Tax=Moorella sp. Hama-1 TaxID=2138101 RepID=UPI000D64E89F|nr:hypothetical protein [Moorella sp. Hama-1]MDN5361430.1 hypothetical protein [Moorella sp. (in: firmicutes)]BCV21214.1 hypothetical protein hamaS1_12830 [Moorella sp. Hama-1]
MGDKGKRKRYLSLALVLALVLLLVSNGVAMAQSQSTAQPRTSLQQLYLEKLSGVLGIDQGQLQADMKTAGQQALDAAVAQGLIDSNRAANLKKALDSGRWPWPLGHKGRSVVWHPRLVNDLASVLGTTPQQLRQDFKNGQTLEQLAAAKGLTLEQLKDQLVNNVKSQLDQAVAAGKLTREKADQILGRLEQLDLSKLPQPHTGK